MADFSHLATMAKNAAEMDELGLMMPMSQKERDKWQAEFPNVEMVLGDFVIMRVDKFRELANSWDKP